MIGPYFHKSQVAPRRAGRSNKQIIVDVRDNCERIYGINSDYLTFSISALSGAGNIVYDFSKYFRSMTLQNGATWENDGLYFDNVDDRIVVPSDAGLLFSNKWTIICKMQYHMTPTVAHPIFRKWTAGLEDLAMIVDAATTFRTNHYGLSVSSTNSNSTLNKNTSYVLGSTYDGASVKLFLNGNKDQEIGRTGNLNNNTGNLNIGYNPESSYYINMTLDTMYWFSLTLNLNQMALIADRPYALSEPILRPSYFFLPPAVEGSTLGFPLTRPVRPKIKSGIQGRSFTAIQRDVRDNCERIYGIDSINLKLAMGMLEGAGNTVHDFSGNGNHGAFVNQTFWEGRGVSADGVDDSINLDFSKLGITDYPFSVAFRCTHHTLNATSNQILFSDLSEIQNSFFFGINPSNLALCVAYKTAFSAAVSTDTVSPGETVSIAGIVEASNNRSVYLNGKFGGNNTVNEAVVFGNIDAFNLFKLDRGISPDAWYKAKQFEHLYIFKNYTLSVAQIALFNDRPYALFEPISRPTYFFYGEPAAPPEGTIITAIPLVANALLSAVPNIIIHSPVLDAAASLTVGDVFRGISIVSPVLAANASLSGSAVVTALENLKLFLSVLAEDRTDLMCALRATGTEYEDLMTWLKAVDGTVLNNLATFLQATDGTVLKDLAMKLVAIKQSPSFTSVVNQRLTSIISEV